MVQHVQAWLGSLMVGYVQDWINITILLTGHSMEQLVDPGHSFVMHPVVENLWKIIVH
jgi:hypothetical protein